MNGEHYIDNISIYLVGYKTTILFLNMNFGKVRINT